MQNNSITESLENQEESLEKLAESSVCAKLTLFTSANGLLCKEFALIDATLTKTTHGRLSQGGSQTLTMSLAELRDFIPTMPNNTALGLGVLREDLEHTANNLKVIAAAALDSTSHARTKYTYQFPKGNALFLADYDGKELKTLSDVRNELLEIMPELRGVGMLMLGSSSNGVHAIDAPECAETSAGCHIYIIVNNGEFIPAIGQLLHYRSWIKGKCYFKQGRAAFLEQTVFDRAVHAPERLVFEAPAALGEGIIAPPRAIEYIEGDVLDVNTLPYMTTEQQQELQHIIEDARAAAKGTLREELQKTGHSSAEIKKIINNIDGNVLSHTAQLQGRKSGVVIVSDIIAAIHAGTGQKFIDDDWLDIDGHTPIFGRTKLYVNNDNSIVLHSFKNGGTSYTLLGDTSKLDESDFLNNTAAEPEKPTQESTAEPDFWHYGNHNANNANNAAEPTPLKTLFNLSTKGSAAVLREQMLTDSFVLDGIAISGHITVIYAKPNTGKTLLVLKMLKDSIDAGRIAPKKIVYVNADDNFNGYVTKLDFAEKAGFKMVAPSIDDFSAKELLFLLQNMITDNSAHGAVVVLDTLKKFTDLMDKKTGSNFMAIARAFSLAGGTMILLAHTNKNRNKDGKAVFGGTSDIVDDCDGAFILDEVTKTENIKTVLFEKIKARGNVEDEVTFSYSSNPKDYIDLIESVTRGDAAQATQAKSFINKLSDKPAIDAILQCLANGVHKRTDILRMNHEGGVSRRTVEKCLDDYTNDLWECKVGENNSKIYYKTNSKTDHLPF